MPQIAILADIHANPFALEAVIQDLEVLGPDEVLLGGDLVGRGPLGKEVVRRVRELGWPSVRGNHEDYLINFRKKRIQSSWLTDPDWAAERWMAAELEEEDARFLEALPFSLHAPTDPQLYLVHGSPRSNQEGIGPWLDPQDIAHIFRHAPGTLLACAHTHRPFEAPLPHRRHLLNVGSVGLPFDGTPKAHYCLVSRTHPQDAWHIEHRAVEYDIHAFLKAYHDSGFLAAGGVKAQMLSLEVTHARPYLVPFMLWCKALERPCKQGEEEAFLEVYDPEAGMRHFAHTLELLAAKDSGP